MTVVDPGLALSLPVVRDVHFLVINFQAAGAGQINQAMQQLRDISLESGKTSSSLQSAADALQTAVEELSEEIARFRTR